MTPNAIGASVSGDGRIVHGGRTITFELGQDAAQGADQFLARDVAFAELHAEAERFVLRLEIEDVGLRARAGGLLFPALLAGLVAGQSAAGDALQRFGHLLGVGLARNLEQERTGGNSLLDATAAQRFGDIAKRKR